MIWFLLILFILSLAANAYQWYRWHSYRTKPAGIHSHTGMMPKIQRDQILRDRESIKRRKDPDDGGEPKTDIFGRPS